MTGYKNVYAAASGITTGTTTNDFVVLADLIVAGNSIINALLKNTHGANTLSYKVTGFLHDATGQSVAIKTATDLTATSTYWLHINPNAATDELQGPYSLIRIEAESKVDDTHATYALDFCSLR